MANGNPRTSLYILGFLTVVFLPWGIIGIPYWIVEYYCIRSLEKNITSESAVITSVGPGRTGKPSFPVFFTTNDDGKIYRQFLIKPTPGVIKTGEEIEVKFNDNRNLFLITNYAKETYIYYIVLIVLQGVVLFLGILFLRGTIAIHKALRDGAE